MNKQCIALEKIRIDGDTQPRVAIDQDIVAEYAQALQAGAEFPPVQVVCDGATHWLVDGFHRYYAHRSLGREQIEAEVITGLLDEARWLSLTSNQTHGLRRSNADKANAVMRALKLRPDLSDAVLAEHIGVSDRMVGKYRQSTDPVDPAVPASHPHRKSPLPSHPIASDSRSGPKVSDLNPRVGRDGKKYAVRPKPAVSPKALPPRCGHSVAQERKYVGLSPDPAMGARALFELFEREYLQKLLSELRDLLDGRAGPAPSLRDLPQSN